MIVTELRTTVPEATSDERRAEPLTAGVPLPAGAITDPAELALFDANGHAVPTQFDVIDRWPADGTARWILVDAQLDVPASYVLQRVSAFSPPHHDTPLLLSGTHSSGYLVATNGMTYVVRIGTDTLLAVTPQQQQPTRHVRLRVIDGQGRDASVRATDAVVETSGELRVTIRLELEIAGADWRLAGSARISFFAGLPTCRVEVTVANRRRAKHKGGYWELGDPGSAFVRDVSVLVDAPDLEKQVLVSVDADERLRAVDAPAVIHQESSGGDSWQSPVHRDRNGTVPLRFRGYALKTRNGDERGDRAVPVFMTPTEQSPCVVAVRHFWQNFPTSLEAAAGQLRCGLFPDESGAPHEIQGGEQKTHTLGVAYGLDGISQRPLDWIVRPALLSATPAWYARASAAPYLSPVADPGSPYERAVAAAIEGDDAFARKRERIDEFGWRHFGDIYADHEAVGASHEGPLVSHYNNQYDAINGFAIQFMRSGDPRWWIAMDELARHVVDIDIYHTSEDKAAFSGGLFWHTFHYRDAGRSTHRSYPASQGISGGGPSNEHNYSTGLLHFYLLTGEPWAKHAAIGLADWVRRMDDGRLTVFRWLSRGDTGLASATASPSYHGPGRGAGNSIVALLNGFRLTGGRQYLAKAEQLIRRCIHPNDDVAARNLLDVEQRWSYTVFLQALGRYLAEKEALGEADRMYGYARESLRRYARWMLEHEYPYLERPEVLEYPTETWAAQDMRKSEVFLHASRYASGTERAQILERAAFFFEASLDWLYRFESRTLARPLVLLLSYGYMYRTVVATAAAPPLHSAAPDVSDWGRPESFVPQKQIAFARAKWIAGLLALLTIVLAVAIFALRS